MPKLALHRVLLLMGFVLWTSVSAEGADDRSSFEEDVAPILARRCFSCHNERDQKGDFSLETISDALENELIVRGEIDESSLIEMITPNKHGKAEMPKNSDPLTKEEIATIRKWIADGAKWPEDFRVAELEIKSTDWWSLQPLTRPEVPKLDAKQAKWTRTPIDAFVAAKHRQHALTPAVEADRRTLIRRLYFDMIGMPPPPPVVDTFINDKDPKAYDKLVDRLLASEHYGERWARHWLDVVHYGDTHGYDKDKLRPNAWPYRDYVIRAFNSDRPYGQFIKEQVAGDVMFPNQPHLIAATGFVVAGPWDYIGHVEVSANKIDGKVARNLDRDDMVANTIQTFNSLTVQCARCHNHKFDPITQEDYYSLQAVFAAVGRNDRAVGLGPEITKARAELESKVAKLTSRKRRLHGEIKRRVLAQINQIDDKIQTLESQAKNLEKSPRYGYHSKIERSQASAKWVQVDLGKSLPLDNIVLIAAHDDYADIGAGFGFPVRFKIEISNDAAFKTGVAKIADHTSGDYVNPGVTPVRFAASGKTARFVRVTATKLAPRSNDFIFALAEFQVWIAGANVARGKPSC